jgi:hypothetical protein
MPDPAERMLLLAKRLLERTESGAIAWRKEGDRPQSFETDVGDQLVTIRPRDRDGRQPFVLTLWMTDPEDSTQWTQVEKMDTEFLRGQDAEALGTLWNAARADALNITASIDAALAALNDKA